MRCLRNHSFLLNVVLLLAGCGGSRDGDNTTPAQPVEPAAVDGTKRTNEPPTAQADWTSPTLGLMKRIPAGSFTMGSPSSEPGHEVEETQHKVTLTNAFLLMEHEVTQAQWTSVMGDNPSNFVDCGESCPVERVSWEKAQAFIEKASTKDGVSYRLPSEAEWEYAARGGQLHVYAGGGDLSTIAWYEANSGSTTHAVCGKARNAYGLCDMSGNVSEWVQDACGAYSGDAVDYVNNDAIQPWVSPGVINPEWWRACRTTRGGNWFSPEPILRVAHRGGLHPSDSKETLGFRLALSVQ